MLAFVICVAFGVFLTYYYFGQSADSPLNRIPETQPIAAAADNSSSLQQGFVIQRHTNSPGPIIIGLIPGHSNFDSGAVCDDGLQEVVVTIGIIDQVSTYLIDRGIDAEILDEYDPRLTTDYFAEAVVSVHADSCQGAGADLSGFKTAASPTANSPILQDCIERTYGEQTGLTYNVNTITNHMTEYHLFGRLSSEVPSIIIEAGFLGGDRDLLTHRSDIPAKAIGDGILCFVRANTTN